MLTQRSHSGSTTQTATDQVGGAQATGLFGNSPHSDTSGAFADAVSQPGSRSSSASLATASSFQTATSAQTDGSPRDDAGTAGDTSNKDAGEDEGEGRRSSQRRRRGTGLAGVLGSPSPPRQSRFARFVSSAAAATGLNAGQVPAQQDDLNPQEDSRIGTNPEAGSEQLQSAEGVSVCSHPKSSKCVLQECTAP